jgi:hypothetical protein
VLTCPDMDPRQAEHRVYFETIEMARRIRWTRKLGAQRGP